MDGGRRRTVVCQHGVTLQGLGAATRTAIHVDAQQQQDPLGGRFLGWLWRGGSAEQLAAAGQVVLVAAAGKEAVVANALKASGQHVAEEAAQELVGRERHDLADVASGAVAIVEDYLAVRAREQAGVADGDALGVMTQVVEQFLRTGEGGFAVDDPRQATQLARSEEHTPELQSTS